MALPRKLRRTGRFPKRIRKRGGRVGMYRRLDIIGGAYVAPPVTTPTVYPYRGGGFNPS